MRTVDFVSGRRKSRRVTAPLAVLSAWLMLALGTAACGRQESEAARPTEGLGAIQTRRAALTISPAWESAEAESTESLSWGDMDGDGDLDLAVGNWGKANRIYRNDGGGVFVVAWESTETDQTYGLSFGDVDGDGDLDLAVINWGQPNRVYRNEGGGVFSPAWESAEREHTNSVSWGDVDGDGDLDLVVGNWSEPTRVYRNDGGGVFSPAWEYAEEGETRSVSLGDMDGDGDLDLAVGNWNEVNRVYRNDGSGVFSSAWESAEREATESLIWGDMDGDGDLDLAAGNLWQSNRVYRNEGGGVFSSAWASDESDVTHGVSFGDMDGDGDLDLAVGNYDGPNRVYRNEGGGVFSSAWNSNEGADDTRSLIWGDMDGDGDLDLAEGNEDGPNRVYRNEGGGVFSSAWESLEADFVTSVSLGDMDGDGDLDLAVGNYDIGGAGNRNRVYRNGGGGGFSPTWESEFGTTTSVSFGDIDGDGDLDLAAGNWHSRGTRVFRNDGDGVFRRAWTSAEQDSNRGVSLGDMDGDGDLDLAVGNNEQSNRVYRNEGGGVFSLAWTSAETDDTRSVSLGDVDGDGDLDMAVGNSRQSNRVYRNEGGGAWSLAWSSSETDDTTSVSLGDVDGDGDLDLAVGNFGESNRVYRNEGGGVWSLAWSSSETDSTESVSLGDVDGDGDGDLAVGNWSQVNRVYLNEGGGVFSRAWASPETGQTTSLSFGDMDGDGDLDLVVGDKGQAIRVYRNGALVRFDSGSPLPNTPTTGTLGNLPWGGCLDDGTPCAPRGAATLHVPIRLFDAQSDPAARVELLYDASDGGGWRSATLVGDATQLEASPSGTDHTLTWDVAKDAVVAERVFLRLRVYEDPSFAGEPIQHGAMSTARSTVHYSIDTSAPAPDDDGDGWEDFEDCDDAASSCTDDCSDLDGDGVANCLDLCVDADGDDYGLAGDRKVGFSAVAVAACTTDGSTPCSLGDAACLGQDCNDGASSCHDDCTSDVDGDGRLDCLDACIDADRDGFGEALVASCVTDGATPGSAHTDCELGPACLDADCEDAASSCTTDCRDVDLDGAADCVDRCVDLDGDEYGLSGERIVGTGSIPVRQCTTDGTAACVLNDEMCLAGDCDETSLACNVDCTTDLDNNGAQDCGECPDGDVDGDFVCDAEDNCALVANADQLDADADGQGDLCDADDDNDGVADIDDVCPKVAGTSGELVPFAQASPATVGEALLVTLDGSGSCVIGTGSEGLTYLWSQLEGPPVALSSESAVGPLFVAPRVAVDTLLRFELVVEDQAGNQAEVEQDVTVQSRFDDVPVADAGSDVSVVGGQSVTLDGSASFDPNGTGLIYAWRQVTGPSVALANTTGSTLSFVAPEPADASAVLRFTLRVIDGARASAEDYADVRVFAATGLPKFVSMPNTSATLGQPYTYDADGRALASGAAEIAYSVTNPPAGFAIDPVSGAVSWTPTQAGTFPITLTVSNALGSEEQSFEVNVYQAPTILSEPDPEFLLGVPYAYFPQAEGTPELLWEMTAGPPGAIFDSVTGGFKWLPTGADPVDVTLVVRNDHGEASQSFTLARPVQETPRIVRQANLSASVGQPYRYDADGYVDVTGLAPGEEAQLRTLEAPDGLRVATRSFELGWLPKTPGSTHIGLALGVGNVTLDEYSFTVDVTENPPADGLAALSVLPEVGDAPLEVLLNGTGSRGALGAPLIQYSWQSGDGAQLFTAEPSIRHRYKTPGGYQATLEVVDAFGYRSSAKAPVIVRDEGRTPPLALIEYDVLDGPPPLTVQFGCRCQAGDAEVHSHEWLFGDGTTSTEESPTHTFTALGSYQVRLTVDDTQGLTARDSVQVSARHPDKWPPQARIAASALDGDGPLTVRLEASVKDFDGTVERIEWDLPDGTKSSANEVRFVLPEAGHYQVALTATDNDGLVGRDSWSLRVRANGLLPPRILTLPTRVATVGEAYRYAAEASPRAQGSRPLIWSLGKDVGGVAVGAPAGMRIDGVTGALTWTPTEEQLGTHEVTLVVQNEAGADFQEFSVDVAEGAPGTVEDPMSGGGCSVNNGASRHAPVWLFLFTIALVRVFWRPRGCQ